jgi:hypothetical protein
LPRDLLDSGVDSIAVGDHRGDDLAGQVGRHRVAFCLGQVPLEDGRRRSLAELRLEDRSERDAPAGSLRPDCV